jgi:hypothetical protein
MMLTLVNQSTQLMFLGQESQALKNLSNANIEEIIAFCE